jgi:septal ring-binding cell division protein DamX
MMTSTAGSGPATHFREWTIQLGAFYETANLVKEQRDLGAWAKDLMVVPFEDSRHRQGFRLLLGRYASRSEAIQAIEQLPPIFRRSNNKPFPIVLNPDASPRRLP